MKKYSEQKTLPLFYLLILLVFCGCKSGGGASDLYPSRPVTYIVPWAPGGMTDMSSRMMAISLQKYLGVTVNVVNRTGGGGVIGHLALSQSKPDGYTLGAVTGEITQMHHMGLTDLTHRDYTPLALVLYNPAAITVRIDAPYQSLEDLVQAIRDNPGALQASGTARGGIWDIARIGFLKAAGFTASDMPWVPSQGAAPALQELIAGGVEVVTASLAEVDGLRKAGQVRTLAVMADNRLSNFSDIPTLKEKGIDWSVGGWVSVCAPSGLDQNIKKQLDSVIHLASMDTSFINTLTRAGSSLRYMKSSELSVFMEKEDVLNGVLMSESGMAQ